MAFIYVITNNINGKQYVGKTNGTIEKRFKEHIKESKRQRCEKRPLYSAMNKYGVEHFSIAILEECSAEKSADREIYWIDRLQTYGCLGYNATRGGDSKKYYDYRKIVDKYLELHNQKETAKYFHCDVFVVRQACKELGVPIYSSTEWVKQHGQTVAMIDKETNEIIQIFNTIADAYRFLNKPHSGHIASVCNGQRKIAYGYKWKYLQTIDYSRKSYI